MDQLETMMPQAIAAETMAPKTFWGKWLWWIIAGIIILAVGFAFYWFNLLPFNLTAAPKYQAVFLSNGQVYFGKLASEKGDYAKLTNIYYLQVQQAVQQAAPVQKDAKGNVIQQPVSAPQPDIRLVKLGSELHGPEDIMYVSKSQILFYEDLKDDSRVVQAIKTFEGKK